MLCHMLSIMHGSVCKTKAMEILWCSENIDNLTKYFNFLFCMTAWLYILVRLAQTSQV